MIIDDPIETHNVFTCILSQRWLKRKIILILFTCVLTILINLTIIIFDESTFSFSKWRESDWYKYWDKNIKKTFFIEMLNCLSALGKSKILNRIGMLASEEAGFKTSKLKPVRQPQ